MEQLSPQELSDFYRHIGREIDSQYIPAEIARYVMDVERRDKERGARYSQRVWSERSRTDYISQQVAACAQFAAGLASDSTRRTYLLADKSGRPSLHMGHVHFRLNEYCPSLIGLPPSADNKKRFPTIESIDLHPSVRQKGFFSALLKAMKRQEFIAVAIGNIANPFWAYHFYQKSLVSSQVVLLSPLDTVDFSTNVSPMPTFGLRI